MLGPELAVGGLMLWGVLVLTGALYLWAARWQRRRGRQWPVRRSVLFLSGLLLIALAFSPDLSARAHRELPAHMIQHLLVGMFAPLGLVFAAPMTLLLNSLPRRLARRWVRLLHLRPLRWLGHPLVALVLNLGGMYLLYLTPLYGLSLHSPALHAWMHLHFLVAGCIFTWAIAGPDPAPGRPGFQFRLWVLFLSMATHSILAKLMVAYGWPAGLGLSAAEIEQGAKWMYYGGDLAEMILLAALLWNRIHRRRKSGSTSPLRPVT